MLISLQLDTLKNCSQEGWNKNCKQQSETSVLKAKQNYCMHRSGMIESDTDMSYLLFFFFFFLIYKKFVKKCFWYCAQLLQFQRPLWKAKNAELKLSFPFPDETQNNYFSTFSFLFKKFFLLPPSQFCISLSRKLQNDFNIVSLFSGQFLD